MLTIGICDDELEIRTNIRESIIKALINDNTEYQIKEFSKGDDVIKYISSGNEIDILFLDIQMDGLDGMETAHKLREYDRTTEILFVTSVLGKMSEAFKVRAFRFINKPIEYEVIEKNLKECVIEIARKRGCFLKIKTETGFSKVYSRDIVYIEVLNRIVKLYTKEGDFEYRGTLGETMENLEKQLFVQCHRSYVVNLIYIKEVRNKDVIMKDGSVVPISRGKYKEVINRYFSAVGEDI